MKIISVILLVLMVISIGLMLALMIGSYTWKSKSMDKWARCLSRTRLVTYLIVIATFFCFMSGFFNGLSDNIHLVWHAVLAGLEFMLKMGIVAPAIFFLLMNNWLRNRMTEGMEAERQRMMQDGNKGVANGFDK